MTAGWPLAAIAFALGCLAPSSGYCGNAISDPGTPRDFSAATLAKVDPGHTTKAQVEGLLGEPWRTVDSDPDESDPSVWEYRGRNSSGTYRVHVEFDSHDVTSLIATIPDKTGQATARVAKAPPAPRKP
jgi:outer membrane protein assembly factor BamE (lipoprotein component of BamABCDE complex)